MGENPRIYEEIKMAAEKRIPIIVVKGTSFSNEMINMLHNPDEDHGDWNEIFEQGFFHILEKATSEEIASYVHFLLNFSPTERPDVVR